MKRLQLAVKILLRDWRQGELKVLIASVLVAVASITTIGVFVERVQYSIERKASSLLGADRKVTSKAPIDETWIDKAKEYALAVSQSTSLVTMMASADEFQLVFLQAVDEHFPLRGEMRIADQAFVQGEVAQGGPKPGNIWVSPKLLGLLKVAVGSQVQLGDSSFTITKVIAAEPGGGNEVFNVAPNVYLNSSDLSATNLIQPGSRITYNLLVAGTSTTIKEYSDWLNDNLSASQNILGGKNSSQALGRAFERADKYLHLAAIVSVLLAGVAIAMASQRYAQRHFDSVAIFRCLGARRNDALMVFLSALVILSALVSAIGVILGFALQAVLFEILKDYFNIDIDYVIVKPIIVGLATGVIIILGFSAPGLMRLGKVSPLRVIRRDLEPISVSNYLVYACSMLTVSLLLFWYTGNAPIVIAFVILSPVLIIAFLFFSSIIIRAIAKLSVLPRQSYRFGLQQLIRFKAVNQVQIAALSFAILIVMVVLYVRSDLLDEWQAKIPDDSPNFFIVNIQPEQVEAVKAFFEEENIAKQTYYPMVRGRLSHVNGQAVEERYANSAVRHNSLRRELNLSWASEMQSSNRIDSGTWHGGAADSISIESRLADALDIQLGDEMTFIIAGDSVAKTVSSFRDVEWDSFQPNFYVIFGDGVLEPFPKSFITSIYLAGDRQETLIKFVKQFPTITLIDLAPIMNQVREILDQVTLAVEFIFGFTFFSGLVVLFASLESTMDERQLNSVLIRTLGASRKFITSSLNIEMASIGVMAGLLAALGTEVIGMALANWIFNMEMTLHPWLWIFGPIMGVLATWLASFHLVRQVVSEAPINVLRRLG